MRPLDCIYYPGDDISNTAIQSLSDITGSNLSDYMKLPLEQQKALYYFSNICSSFPQVL